MASARTSLPVPVSPSMTTGTSLAARRSISGYRRVTSGLLPMNRPKLVRWGTAAAAVGSWRSTRRALVPTRTQLAAGEIGVEHGDAVHEGAVGGLQIRDAQAAALDVQLRVAAANLPVGEAKGASLALAQQGGARFGAVQGEGLARVGALDHY